MSQIRFAIGADNQAAHRSTNKHCTTCTGFVSIMHRRLARM